MEKEGLMPDHDGFPVSRDWADLDCGASGCAFNRVGKCSVPSIAKVGEDGRCVGFTPEHTLHVKDEKDASEKTLPPE